MYARWETADDVCLGMHIELESCDFAVDGVVIRVPLL